MSSTGELASMILHELLDAVPVLDCKYEELAPGVMLLVDVLLREYCSDDNVAARLAGLKEDLKILNEQLLAVGLAWRVQKRYGGTADDQPEEEDVGYFCSSSACPESYAPGSFAGSTKASIGDLERAEQWLQQRAESADMSSTGELASMILHELPDAVPVLDCKYEELAPGVMLLVDVLLREYCSDDNVAARLAGLKEDLKILNEQLLAVGLAWRVQKRYGGTADDQPEEEDVGFFTVSSVSIDRDASATGSGAIVSFACAK